MQRSCQPWVHTLPLLLLLPAAQPLAAGDTLRWGLQAGLMAPLQTDLKIVTGSGLNPLGGLHLDWNLSRSQTLRTRVDAGFFSSTDQSASTASFQQTIHTRFRNVSLGAEYLFRPGGGPLTLGPGIYLIRWMAHSTNSFVTPTGTFNPSGTSTWTREGFGVAAGLRLSRHLETEARITLSHDGYENMPTRMGSFNLVWQF